MVAFGLGMAAAAAIDHTGKVAKSSKVHNPSTASVTDDYMGPSAFMWPYDRTWSGDMDNTAPCGSSAGATKRTEFPLAGGAVALVAQDDYYHSKISISYSNEPKKNADFSLLVQANDLNDLDPGHTCFSVPDAPEHIKAGTNATLQVVYQADWDASVNQTFYACADIVFVDRSDFRFKIPCFNATEPGEDNRKAAEANKAVEAESASDSAESPSNAAKMGSGAKAGTIVGSLGGASAVAVGGIFLYRRRQQKKRALRHAHMEEKARHGQYPLDKGSPQTSA